MRNLAMVSFVALSFCFAACADDAIDDGANAPAEQSAPSEQAPSPNVSPLATTVVPTPPPAAPADPPKDDLLEDSGVPLDLGDASAPPPAEDASAPEDGGLVIIGVFLGTLHVTEKSGATCTYYVDGASKGTSQTLDVTVGVGEHEVACKAADGRYVTQKANVGMGATTNVVLELPPVEAPAGNGTLVAVAVGGTCAFSVNGAAKGTTSTLKLSLPPGAYTVACKPSTGAATKSRSVFIKVGETAMTMFKLSE